MGETVLTRTSKHEFGILYLDKLEATLVSTRAELNELKKAATIGGRPFITLRYRERADRFCWHPQETHYLSNI